MVGLATGELHDQRRAGERAGHRGEDQQVAEELAEQVADGPQRGGGEHLTDAGDTVAADRDPYDVEAADTEPERSGERGHRPEVGAVVYAPVVAEVDDHPAGAVRRRGQEGQADRGQQGQRVRRAAGPLPEVGDGERGEDAGRPPWPIASLKSLNFLSGELRCAARRPPGGIAGHWDW
ncbi:hypothetical protein AB0M79_13595 [Polymorphospora sp. NPDC051019]|uniref:hypothetical protein n=1 Tax=Polymorphospora sp. NPDC051019 TaxID=3155725 RepID=UPI00341FD1CB